ncbi:MAG: hypothetical protein WCF12_14320 [Propionicimonas sp.]
MSENGQNAFKPPYMAFQTFWNFVGDLSAHPLPPQIDRSMMASKSGTDQANLINTLKALGLVDDEHRVLPGLTALTDADPEARSALLADIVRRDYAAALAVADNNGTASQLEQCFRDSYAVAGADTLRKSITFFLHAARAAGVPLSPHFKQTRAGSGAPGQPRKRPVRRKSKNGISDPEVTAAPQPAIPDAYRLDVRLRTGGTMTLTVNVNPISLRGEDRTFFYDIVDKMTDYEPTDVAGQHGDSEEGLLDET